jgi:hypothetical protein
VFFKLTGPAKTIAANQQKFEQLLASLQLPSRVKLPHTAGVVRVHYPTDGVRQNGIACLAGLRNDARSRLDLKHKVVRQRWQETAHLR